MQQHCYCLLRKACNEILCYCMSVADVVVLHLQCSAIARSMVRTVCFGVLPLVMYAGCFYIHLSLLHTSGPDAKSLSAQFQASFQVWWHSLHSYDTWSLQGLCLRMLDFKNFAHQFCNCWSTCTMVILKVDVLYGWVACKQDVKFY